MSVVLGAAVELDAAGACVEAIGDDVVSESLEALLESEVGAAVEAEGDEVVELGVEVVAAGAEVVEAGVAVVLAGADVVVTAGVAVVLFGDAGVNAGADVAGESEDSVSVLVVAPVNALVVDSTVPVTVFTTDPISDSFISSRSYQEVSRYVATSKQYRF
ncbi:hypothetical protein PRNP1_010386 [Phytophthora ramorum]